MAGLPPSLYPFLLRCYFSSKVFPDHPNKVGTTTPVQLTALPIHPYSALFFFAVRITIRNTLICAFVYWLSLSTKMEIKTVFPELRMKPSTDWALGKYLFDESIREKYFQKSGILLYIKRNAEVICHKNVSVAQWCHQGPSMVTSFHGVGSFLKGCCFKVTKWLLQS